MGVNKEELFDKVVNLSKRRGFVFQSADIYGGFRSTYDYGPVGVLLLRNVKDQWWRSMVQLRQDVVGLDASILSPPSIWEASGHLTNFTDPLVDCRECGSRFRQDKLEDPNTKTHAGPVMDSAAEVYLRPETAQGMFTNFANVLNTSRKKPPFGIAQIGKSFRNEITSGNFVFRTREFEQMEMEYFVPPNDSDEWFDYWCQERMNWYLNLGMKKDSIRLRVHESDELSHYSKATSDIEYSFPWGWDELEGVANRTDFDLNQHAQSSGNKLEYNDSGTGERYVPHVIEPAAGATRTAMAFLMDAYDEEEVNGEVRNVLKLDHRLAPYKVAVLPLSKKDELIEPSKQVLELVQPHWMCDYDQTQAIGRRYRRQDEIGTPYCVTIDFETIEDKAVTVRERDSMNQDRVSINELVDYLSSRLVS